MIYPLYGSSLMSCIWKLHSSNTIEILKHFLGLGHSGQPCDLIHMGIGPNHTLLSEQWGSKVARWGHYDPTPWKVGLTHGTPHPITRYMNIVMYLVVICDDHRRWRGFWLARNWRGLWDCLSINCFLLIVLILLISTSTMCTMHINLWDANNLYLLKDQDNK